MIPAPKGAFFIPALIVHAGSRASQDRLWSVCLLRESYRQSKFRTLQNRSALTGLFDFAQHLRVDLENVASRPVSLHGN
jgi:hypothetical protein